MKPNDAHVSVQLLGANDHKHPLKVSEDAPLLDVLQDGADALSVKLLPDRDKPLDQLHNLAKHGQPGPAIEDLQQPIGKYLAQPDTTHDFGIELVLAIRVNTRWAVAPKASMSPHEILDLFKLNYQEYSLYRERSADLLPLDTALTIHRGVAFEAQRDGKYGEGT